MADEKMFTEEQAKAFVGTTVRFRLKEPHKVLVDESPSGVLTYQTYPFAAAVVVAMSEDGIATLKVAHPTRGKRRGGIELREDVKREVAPTEPNGKLEPECWSPEA